MKNIIATVPKSKFATWELAERVLKRCDGETDWSKVDNAGSSREQFWFVRLAQLPKAPLTDSVCFMIYGDRIRGYFHIVSSDRKQTWIEKGYMQSDKPTGFVVVLANWVPIPYSQQVEMPGFQGWRYTALMP